MFLLVSKKDFPAYVAFSANVGDQLVLPHLQDAQLFDVRPLLPGELEAMEAAAQAAAPRLEFRYLEFDPREFFAEDLPTDWPDPRLYTLFMAFVRPLLVCEAFRRMIPWHGKHVTPNGIEVISDAGHQPITAADRAELRGDILAKCNYYRHRLLTALATYRGTALPAPACSSPRRRRAGSGGTHSYAL